MVRAKNKSNSEIKVVKPRVRRVELPPKRQVVSPDEQMQQVLDKCLHGKMVEIFYEPDPERDYMVPLPDGTFDIVCEAPSINGVQFFLKPGKNKIPRFLYDHLMQTREDATKKRILPGDNKLADWSRR